MKVVCHPAVQGDVSRILRHYDGINDRLGDEFWEELNAFIQQDVANPERFHFDVRDRRRVNLRRFPYHFLFRAIPDGIRVTVIRHHKQWPEYGLKRRYPEHGQGLFRCLFELACLSSQVTGHFGGRP
jgi:plasmid stabilization system protein ParE